VNLTDRALYAVEVVEDILVRWAKRSPIVVLTRNQQMLVNERYLRLGIDCAQNGVTLTALNEAKSKPARHLHAV
jgi:hypothetical protein